jgi:hypothetical protein
MENYVASLLASLGIDGERVPSGRSASGYRVA